MASKYLKKKEMYNIFKKHFSTCLAGANLGLDCNVHIDVPKMKSVNYMFYRGSEWIKYYDSIDDYSVDFVLYHCNDFYRLHVDVFVNYRELITVFDVVLDNLAV